MGNVLITGGAGFIGSHTADILTNEGYRVIVLDNLSSGKRSNLNKKTHLLKGNLLTIGKLKEKLRPIDYVVHCAAQISVNSSIINPEHDAATNIIGSLKLLRLCNALKVKKMVFASSAAVYGLSPSIPATEQSESPQSPYAISKFAFEKYLASNLDLNGMDYASLRYSNVYGPRQNHLGEAGVVTLFTDNLLRKKRPTIYGDGKQTRDFIFVQDVARANALALQKKSKQKVFNISSMSQLSISDLLSKLASIMGVKAHPLHRPPRKGDVRLSCLDNSAAKKILNWKPRVAIDEGLTNTVNWSSTSSMHMRR